MTTLDVLLLEATPGDGADDALRLEAAGHRVHRCFDPEAPVDASGWRPCLALTDGQCPLDGHIDVALLARQGIAPRPGPGEIGVRCTVRAGVPLVEDGGDLLDPFAPWVDFRTDGRSVVAACEETVREALGPVRDRLQELCGRLLEAQGAAAGDLRVRAERDGDHLSVVVTGPALPPTTARAVCDRALTALRELPRRYAVVDVSYEAAELAAAPA